MSIRDYLESEPFFEIQRYTLHAAPGRRGLHGNPRKHPYDDGKIVLVGDPGAENPGIYEFLVGDIVHAEDLASPVTQSGESYPRVRIWIRRGSVGIRYEPFEVDTPPRFFGVSPDLKISKLSPGSRDRTAGGSGG
ncbi:MAG: hypothetical protein MZU97_08000 [Bacillus subtilis]|nr:hypothetical protein [Bacillus subtilis]